MIKNKYGYVVPDAYTSCVLLVAYNKDEEQFYVVMSEYSSEEHLNEIKKLAIPEDYVAYGLMANETALNIITQKMMLDVKSIFVRHIGVFDSPERDTRGWYITNLFYAVVNFESLKQIDSNYKIISKDDLLSKHTLAFDHLQLAQKVLKNIENDVYTQIFNKTLFETDVISELLGNTFSASDLQELGRYVGLKYDRTTYYRNIEKYYQKCGTLKINGIKKPINLYQKEKNEQY